MTMDSPLLLRAGRSRARPKRQESRAANHALTTAPLAIGIVVVLIYGDVLEPWAWMWLLAITIFAGCKWVTLRRAIAQRRHVSLERVVGYLALWPGMDAHRFLDRQSTPTPATAQQFREGAVKLLFGAAILWGVVPRLALAEHPLVVGWLGMVGFVLVLHFGVFDLLSALWRIGGIDAQPLMNRPASSASLSAFWGRRWNSAFRSLAHTLMFRPIARRAGVAPATLLTFIASGLVHDLVISVPAGGGYGLPTLYFAIQGIALLLERSRIGDRFDLSGGVQGRIFMAVVIVGPVGLLFHSAFVERVVIPFLEVIGSCTG